MGYTTEFDGTVRVEPPLNGHEIDYLTRFSKSRRNLLRTGPYDASNQSRSHPSVIDCNAYAEGQPSLWCDWAPTPAGDAIEWNQTEKFHDADIWMAYLIDKFLRPGASVQSELAEPVPGRFLDPAFVHFTFDHVLNGVIDAQGEDPFDTWRIVVRDNRVERIDLDRGSMPSAVEARPGMDHLDRFTLTYGHDELNLWCTHPDCEDDEDPVWQGFGGPDGLPEVAAAAIAHAAQHDPTGDADA